MRSIFNLSALAFATALVSSQLAAEEQAAEGFFVNPQAQYYYFDSDRNLEDSFVPALGLGYQFNNPWALELNYLTRDVDLDQTGGGDVDFEQFRLDALYHLDRREKWQPYLAFGVGENDFDTALGTVDETLFNIGGGLKYFLTEALSIRTDLRAINSMDEEDIDLALSLGLNYRFGARTAPSTPPPETAAIPEAPADSDRDGVVDATDQCPNTDANVAVDYRGCELDRDGDGVADSRDKCPDTEPGARVDETGCYIVLHETKTIEMQINFANNSAEVPETSIDEIQKVADFMKEYPLTEVVVEGHTDNRGREEYNQQLSERRARAVAAILVNRLGIAADRVSSVGKGESSPIADNETAQGRAANRRVVGVISATVEKRAMKTSSP